MKSRSNFSGTWVSIDDVSSVEITIGKARSGYSISAKDGHDGEVAAVSEIAYRESDEVLLFATYWTSTGRFTRYQMRLHGHDKVKITYTHTDSEILLRKT